MKLKARWYGTSNIEKIFLTLIFCGALLVLFYQTMMSQSPLKEAINQVGSDAQTVLQPMSEDDQSLILQLVNYSTLPKATVLVNGSIKGDFSHPYVTIPVADGDLIEVDVTYYNHPVVVKVLDSSKGIVSPAKGVEFSGKRTVLVLGKVTENK